MRAFLPALVSSLLLVGCGLPQTTVKGMPHGKAPNGMSAKSTRYNKDNNIDEVLGFLLDNYSRKPDFGAPFLVLFPQTNLHVTADASKSIPTRDDGNISTYEVAHLVADGKLEIDDSDPTNAKSSAGGLWIAVAQTTSSGGDFDKLLKQRDYYAAATVGNDAFYTFDKVQKLDTRLIGIANADATMGNDGGCDELKTMAKYYANMVTPPHDGQLFDYHHKQLLAVMASIFDIAQKATDYDLLTFVRDFYASKDNDKAFPDGGERATLIKQVNDAIDRLFGADRLARSQAAKR